MLGVQTLPLFSCKLWGGASLQELTEHRAARLSQSTQSSKSAHDLSYSWRVKLYLAVSLHYVCIFFYFLCTRLLFDVWGDPVLTEQGAL